MKRTKTALSLRTAALLLALLMLMQVLTACQIGNIIDQVTSESTTSAETLFETTSPDGETTGGETTADTTVRWFQKESLPRWCFRSLPDR